MRTPLVSLLSASVHDVLRELCAESSADSARQHHKLMLLDSKQAPVRVCNSAVVFVSIMLADADHVCMRISNVSQVYTDTQHCVAMLGICPYCQPYSVVTVLTNHRN